MCGIYALFGASKNIDDVRGSIDKISYRGPDDSRYERISDDIIFGFHRLSIVGVSELGNQPLRNSNYDNLTLICNGEIYNYKELANKYQFKIESGSDCEIILHMYNKFGIEKTVKDLDGVFAFALYDKKTDTMFSARDPFGVRPSFIGRNDNGEIFISSEMKSISDDVTRVSQFPPGCWWSSNFPDRYNRYYDYNYEVKPLVPEEKVLSEVRSRLIMAVKKRMMSDREIGCLLSGGLDSSLIASIVSRFNNGYDFIDGEWVEGANEKSGYRLKTFSIGMSGSPDLDYAKKVAEHIGSDHHEVLLTEDEFLNAIEDVIYKIESYDTTTVRASVGNYLVSKYISDNTDCKVVFNGDGSDEVCCGYVYNINAPTNDELQKEAVRLVTDIHLFDVLRSDRSISSNGLEPRTPFLDKEFVKYYMEIDPRLKSFDKESRIEKYILRNSFSSDNLIPDEVLWRDKCAFSDGVSSIKKSWHKTVKDFVDEKISDSYFKNNLTKIIHCKPVLKESFYYREVFEKHYGGHSNVIPYFWMPKWSSVIDPSARELDSYKE